MRTRQFQLSERQVQELQCAERHCRDGATKTRYQAVRLYGLGYAVATIVEITGCSRPSLMEWCRTYRGEGVAGLVDKRQGGNRALLSASTLEGLQQLLHGYTPGQLLGEATCVGNGQFWTLGDLMQWVKARYGVVYQSKTSYYSLFAKCGFTRQRPGHQYRSRSEEAVLEFEQLLEKN